MKRRKDSPGRRRLLLAVPDWPPIRSSEVRSGLCRRQPGMRRPVAQGCACRCAASRGAGSRVQCAASRRAGSRVQVCSVLPARRAVSCVQVRGVPWCRVARAGMRRPVAQCRACRCAVSRGAGSRVRLPRPGLGPGPGEPALRAVSPQQLLGFFLNWLRPICFHRRLTHCPITRLKGSFKRISGTRN